MATISTTVDRPDDLAHAAPALAEGDTNATTLRALQEYVTATAKRLDSRTTAGARSRLISRPWAHCRR